MDPKERINDLLTAVQEAVQGALPSIWTSMPGILQSFNPDAMTCEVQPAIQARVNNKDGTQKWVTLPVLVDVPVQFIGGGGFTLTMPMKKGDEGLINFSCRCIDAWWQNGGVQQQAEMRMHDLSDGFFIPGFRSQSRKLQNIDTENAQLRNEDGTESFTMAPTGITAKSALKVTLEAPIIILKGGVQVDGTVNGIGGGGTVDFGTSTIKAADAQLGGKSFNSHKHGGVQTGSGQTGAPD